ncbi:phage tail protein [Citrobacter braakii]|uniref:phage tail protein n=1 Tax=Citrobacter braakii TaxID=57706 RepID=UPI00201B8BBC|nr:phage tail protein [Citrobacter braakii]
MSENNYGALMMKSAVGVSYDINAILSPGIYIIPPANASSPDSSGGVLTIYAGNPIRREFVSDLIICATSSYIGNSWTSWASPSTIGSPIIGIPFFWPSSAMPNTVIPEWAGMVFLKFNGSTFSAAAYPKLALVIPGLTLPDARGEFPRIWDDGRGVDRGRDLLSYQGDASRNITGSFGGTTNNDTCSVLGNGAGVFANGTTLVTPTNGSVIGSATRPVTMILDISRQVPTAAEFRSRNIAFNFLVRAK